MRGDWFPRATSWVLLLLDRRRIYRGRRNLRQVFPRLPARARRRIVRGAYVAFRRHQLALPVLNRMSAVTLCERLTLEGWREVDRAAAAQPGRGLIFLGLALGFSPLLERALELYCGPLVTLGGPWPLDSEAGTRVLGHLAAGGHVLAPCGFPTMSESAAAFAIAARAQSVPVIASGTSQRFRIVVRPALDPSPDLASRYRALLAEEVDRDPESWPWHLASPDLPAPALETP